MMGRVYDIGDFRVEITSDSNGFTFSGDKECHHRNLSFREEGEIITCQDCKETVTAWWAFLSLTKKFKRISDRIEMERKQLDEEKSRNLTHKAAIAVEDAWRKRKMVPTCPHCWKPILPQDGLGSTGFKNREHYASESKPLEFRMCPEVVAGYKSGK